MSKSRQRRERREGEDNFPIVVIYAVPVILCCVCYANGLTGDFVHDDVYAIQGNKDVSGDSSIMDVFSNDFWGRRIDDPNSHKSYRPLCVLTFRWNYHWSQGDPRWFHVVNLALHICVTCVITHVCLHALHISQLCTFLAVSLFAVHPIHTEAVTGIVGRADVMAALGVLLAFYVYARNIQEPTNDVPSSESPKDINDNRIPDVTSPSILPVMTSLVLTGAATLCKETGIMGLAICLIYDLLLHRKELYFSYQTRIISKLTKLFLLRSMCLAFTGMCLVLFRLWINNFEPPKFLEEDNPASFSPHLLSKVLTYSYLLVFNLCLLLCPSTLSYDWQGGSIPLVETLLDLRNVATALLFVVVLWGLRRLASDWWTHDSGSKGRLFEDKNIQSQTARTVCNKWQTCVMSLVFLCVPFVPASNVFLRVGFVVAERILYLPSLGFCLLVAHGLCSMAARWPRVKPHLYASFMVLLLVFVYRTILRNQDWQSRRALFRSGVRNLPHNAKVHYNLANYLRDIEDLPGAEEHYRIAITLNPDHPSYHNNLGTILTNQIEAQQLFEKALKLRPDHKLSMVNLGNLLLEQNNQTGLSYLHQALEVDPSYIDALLSLGRAMLDSGQLDRAELYLRRARDIRPDLPDVHTYYGTLFQKSGQYEDALNEFQQAFAINSNHLATVKSAATSLRRLRRYTEAERLLKQAVSVASDSEIYTQLGLVYSEMGQNLDALDAFKNSLELAPNDTLVNLRYLKALEDNHQNVEVYQRLEQLLHRDPTNVDVLQFAYIFAQHQGQYNKAVQYLQSAIRQAKAQGHPHLGTFYHDLGNIYRESDDMNKAVENFEASLVHDPTNPGSYINLGALYHLKADYEQAETNYLKALELEPNNALCRLNLQKLRNVWQKPAHSKESIDKT